MACGNVQPILLLLQYLCLKVLLDNSTGWGNLLCPAHLAPTPIYPIYTNMFQTHFKYTGLSSEMNVQGVGIVFSIMHNIFSIIDNEIKVHIFRKHILFTLQLYICSNPISLPKSVEKCIQKRYVFFNNGGYTGQVIVLLQ